MLQSLRAELPQHYAVHGKSNAADLLDDTNP